jgi:hypothetical protein
LELDGLALDHRDVADAHAGAASSPSRADVDVQVLELGRLVALLLLEEVDRLLADDRTGPSACETTRWPTRITGSQPPTP